MFYIIQKKKCKELPYLCNRMSNCNGLPGGSKWGMCNLKGGGELSEIVIFEGGGLEPFLIEFLGGLTLPLRLFGRVKTRNSPS